MVYEVAPCASPNLTCFTGKLYFECLRIWSGLGQSIQVILVVCGTTRTGHAEPQQGWEEPAQGSKNRAAASIKASLIQGFCPTTELPVPSILFMLQGDKTDSSANASLPCTTVVRYQLSRYFECTSLSTFPGL